MPAAHIIAASLIVWNDDGEILLRRRQEGTHWALPGGIVPEGQTPLAIRDRTLRSLHQHGHTYRRALVHDYVKIPGIPDSHITVFDGGLLSIFNQRRLGDTAHETSTWVAPYERQVEDYLPYHVILRIQQAVEVRLGDAQHARELRNGRWMHIVRRRARPLAV